jgi:UDP-N-acetylglucosamine acyltransferase
VIHPTALIDATARLAPDVTVGAHAIIEAGVVIGPGSTIAAHAIIKKNTVLGKNVQVDHFTVLGGNPQDLSFKSDIKSNVQIGDGTILREHVTVHRATQPGLATIVGQNNLLMAGSHVAHDCVLGNHVILANGCMLGGHVQVGDHAFISGGVAVHQFCRVGTGSMTSGNAVITEDVPPHALAHSRNQVSGLNLVGMRRRGLSTAEITELKKAFHAVYAPNGNCLSFAQAALESGTFTTTVAQEFLNFFLGGKRGRFVQPE